MATTLIFVRHARHKADPLIHQTEWTLNPLGFEQAIGLANKPDLLRADILYSSKEQKAKLTLDPLAKKLKKEILSSSEFNEVWREKNFLTDAEFALEKDRQLEDLDYHAFNGESGNEALLRFRSGVERLEKEYVDKTVVIASHGTILSIYFADLLGEYDNLTKRWKAFEFGAYGIVESEKVVKDIVS